MSDPQPAPEASVELTEAERAFARALQARKPSPSPSFRGALARQIARLDPGYGSRPAQLWTHAGALLASGAALILIGTLVALQVT